MPSVLSVQNALIEGSLKVWKYWELTNLIVKIFEKRSQGTLFKDVQLILLDDWVFLNPFSTHFCLNVVNFTISSLKFKSGVLKVGNEETRLLKITVIMRWVLEFKCLWRFIYFGGEKRKEKMMKTVSYISKGEVSINSCRSFTKW